MYLLCCPHCRRDAGYEAEGAIRVTCPYCLRTFDPGEPLPEVTAERRPSDAVGLDALVGSDDDGEPDDYAPEPGDGRERSGELDPDEDFEAGV